jgi:hypothetical protein
MPMTRRAFEAGASSPAVALSNRIRAEYEEMPCLRLTLAQAARFWNVDREMCLAALDRLVAAGFLVHGRYGYMRA